MYQCIIFDVDGTMVDTESAVISSYQRIIHEEFGRYFTPEELKAGYGVPTTQALERYGFEDVEEAYKKYHRYLTEAFCDVKAFAGIVNVLESVKEKGLVTGIVTSRNKSEIAMDQCLQGIIKHFDFVVGSEDTQKHKPEAEPIRKLMELAGAAPEETIYIGDTYFDYMCAKNAGVSFALALWGARSTADIRADYDLERPGDILKLLENQ